MLWELHRRQCLSQRFWKKFRHIDSMNECDSTKTSSGFYDYHPAVTSKKKREAGKDVFGNYEGGSVLKCPWDVARYGIELAKTTQQWSENDVRYVRFGWVHDPMRSDWHPIWQWSRRLRESEIFNTWMIILMNVYSNWKDNQPNGIETEGDGAISSNDVGKSWSSNACKQHQP